jgi:hypothetical protein
MRRRESIILSLSVCSSFLSACDDVSPLAYERPPRDADAPDHVDLAEAAECRRCANDVGAICRPARDSCQSADPRCGGLLDCLTDSNCWRQLDARNFGEPPPCAAMCLEEAQVTSINDIAVPTTRFYQCIIDPARCAPACLGSSVAGGDR